jgi:hypothetical protein
MTDQVSTPEAGEQSQETTSEVETIAAEQERHVEGSEQQEVQEEKTPHQKVVPLAALHEERQRVKELRERTKMMEERFNQLQQVVTERLTPQKQEQQPVIPDLNADPVGHFKAENEQLRRQLEAQGRTTQEIQQQIQAQQQYQQIQTHIGTQIGEFAKQKPDVREAINHAQNADVQALVAVGYEPATAAQMVTRQYDQLVFGLIQQGRNVAESMYALAQAKGYQAKQAATGQEKLQNVQKGVAAAKSLGSGGGVTQKLSLQALADMPAEEFAKAVSDAEFRKLFGG